jgi:stress-induced morphogen
MTVTIRGTTDESLEAVSAALAKYAALHSQAEIEGYRQNSVSIHLRIVDPDFRNISRSDRHHIVWEFLNELSEDVSTQLSSLLLLTPEEKQTSFASVEFDDPIPSQL